METSSLIALLFAAGVLIAAFVAARRRHRQYQADLLANAPDFKDLQQIEIIRVQNPGQQDLQAYELLETERQKIWANLSLDTKIAPRKIWDLAFELVRNIAAIYYPDAENPVFRVSLADLVELNDRIDRRILESLDQFPLNTIKDVNIQDILVYKGYYDKMTKLEAVKMFQKYEHLYTLGRYLWMGYNSLNPWYWGQKVVLTAGKEGTFRYLLTTIMTIVGEESILVYSRRNIRHRSMAVEKNIAFEMINMAVSDGVVSPAESDVALDFILNNSRFDDRVKVTLVKALWRKHPVKPVALPEGYTEKDKQRLLEHVERIAKADKSGLLKKREALHALEDSLQVPSSYRKQLDAAPHAEVQSWELMQQSRRREEAILRLMVQAAAIGGRMSAAQEDYILQRAENYPLPFTDDEQGQILHEAVKPTTLDTLVSAIVTKEDKQRALAEALDALLYNLPFTRQKEDFFTQIATVLDLSKTSAQVLQTRLEHLLPPHKLVTKPPLAILKALYRLLEQEEHLTALQETATLYTFPITQQERSRKQTAALWLCVTTRRVLIFAAAQVGQTIYRHQITFQPDLTVQCERGRLRDTYILRDAAQEIRLESALLKSSSIHDALHAYLTPPVPAVIAA